MNRRAFVGALAALTAARRAPAQHGASILLALREFNHFPIFVTDQAQSIALYQQLITGFPDYKFIHGMYYLLAYCLGEMGQGEEAVAAYRALIDRFPKSLVNATLAIEDKRFYEHAGIDYSRIARIADGQGETTAIRRQAIDHQI